jgi:glycosyltransferase involved in cell wall biosynthesis
MSEPIRLLFVVNHAGFFLSHRLPLALAARKAGYDVHVATPRSKHVPQIVAQGLQWEEIHLSRSGRNPLAELRTFRELIRLYRRLRPRIVHHVTSKPVLYGTVAARLTGVHGVVNAISGLGHVFSETGGKRRALRVLVNLAYRAALRHPRMRVIAQNVEHHDAFIADGWCRADQCVLIRGSGVELSEFTPPDRNHREVLTVLFASRMLWTKGVGEFVEAARILLARALPLRFVLAGEPDPDNPSSVPETTLQQWHADGLVTWLGRRSDMSVVLGDADIFCLPTYYGEGIPKVLVEAASSGLPIVTTDWPGCRDLVEDGQNGLLVPIRDVQALADSIAKLAADPDRRRQFGEEGRRRVLREYSLQAVVERTLSLYGELA